MKHQWVPFYPTMEDAIARTNPNGWYCNNCYINKRNVTGEDEECPDERLKKFFYVKIKKKEEEKMEKTTNALTELPNTLQGWQHTVYMLNEEKGWNEGQNMGKFISNLHGEISEAWEEVRKGTDPRKVYYSGDGEIKKPEGFAIELADVFIRLVHTAQYYGIDLQKMVEEKFRFNETRPYRHGGKVA